MPSTFQTCANRGIVRDLTAQAELDRKYIEELEKLLQDNEIAFSRDLLVPSSEKKDASDTDTSNHILQDGSVASLAKTYDHSIYKNNYNTEAINLHFRGLSVWNMIGVDNTIPTVGTALKRLFCGSGKKKRFDILDDITGRINPDGMTLVIGPPGCGKTTFLKVLSDQLTESSCKIDGKITYNGDTLESKKFLAAQLCNYIDEKDQMAATLTVRETFRFAFAVANGGHHSYIWAKNEEAAAMLNKQDANEVKINNVLITLGLKDCADTIIGNEMIRGISGGQRRRAVMGEMLMPNRRLKFMDAISNGLDASTTLDIINALKYLAGQKMIVPVISLLQPAPEVFRAFDDVIVMATGMILYHGPTSAVLEYFTSLGFVCPPDMDVADFLQIIATPERVKYIEKTRVVDIRTTPVPTTTKQLVQAWKGSALFTAMVADMDRKDELYVKTPFDWLPVFREKYSGSFWFFFVKLLERQYTLTMRDAQFLKARLTQTVVISIIAATLFVQLDVEDTNSMMGILFFSSLFSVFSGLATLPSVFAQREVFYKHTKAKFYPATAFVLSQALILYPLTLIETILFSNIVYWSVGMSAYTLGSRFFTFIVLFFIFNVTMAQLFRVFAMVMPSLPVAQPLGGVIVVLQVLFSGYIVPPASIPDGWIWFYRINPLAYMLQSLAINEFTSPDYNRKIGDTVFGDLVLEARGWSSDERWIWYGALILLLEYLILLIVGVLVATFTVIEPVPSGRVEQEEEDVQNLRGTVSDTVPALTPTAGANTVIREFILGDDTGGDRDKTRIVLGVGRDARVGPNEPYEAAKVDEKAEEVEGKDTSDLIPFEAMSLAFRDICYTVSIKNGEELDLLKNVSGFFEPETLTALMGSSGAGKTTLLDVLAGRKNTGSITGEICVNGKPKDEQSFRRRMGYVEQFDSLAPHDTAREAVEFAAALRLPRSTSYAIQNQWVTNVLDLLELGPLANTMIGDKASGMSFEQRKRVSIALELAANPAILFLDEPTSGLDSRAAEVVIRCIKRVAKSGRSIVSTIHQPSTSIFESFDSLLLLRRGGKTVFFGNLGKSCVDLVNYFQGAPGVTPKPLQQNPASWMLEVIGAGTAGQKTSEGSTAQVVVTDFHSYYKESTLCASNTIQTSHLCRTHEGEGEGEGEGEALVYTALPLGGEMTNTHTDGLYNASYSNQFLLLRKRILLAFWRSPSYNLIRMITSVLMALIFSSTYVNQSYTTEIDVISRVAVIYITVLFMGVVGMMSVQPMMMGEREAFYREKQSNIYDVKLYVLTATLVEIPYLILSSVLFLIPYFFIVGFDNGDVTVKFFWYWVFQALYMSTLVFFGHFLTAALPTAMVGGVIGGMCSTLISLFAGFMILPSDMPSFWQFLYWLDPLHYALEGIVVTQFEGDDKVITSDTNPSLPPTTASAYVSSFYVDFDYAHRGPDVFMLLLFIVVLRIATYFALANLHHQSN